MLTVILYPGIKAGFFGAHHQTARRVLKRLNGSRLGFKKLLVGNEPRPAQRQRRVVIRNSFCDPEQFRIVLFCVIKGSQGIRTYSLHVPQMEKLVRYEREESPIVALRFETEPRKN